MILSLLRWRYARLNEALEEIERINGLLPVDDAKVEDNIQF